MSVQTSTNNNIRPFVLNGSPAVREGETIVQDAARTAVLAPYTLMAKVSASGKWTPFGDNTATDGTAIPRGIYVNDEITAAALVAADIEDCSIIVGGDAVYFDENQLVIEELISPALDLDSVITVGTNDLCTVREWLYRIGLFAQGTVDVDGYENS